jgi:hypothetical protein
MTEKSHAESGGKSGGHRGAVERVRRAQSFTADLPIVGKVRLPRPEQVAFYAALGVLAAVEIVEWPVAAVLAAGHFLVQNQHNAVEREIGQALEEA